MKIHDSDSNHIFEDDDENLRDYIVAAVKANPNLAGAILDNTNILKGQTDLARALVRITELEKDKARLDWLEQTAFSPEVYSDLCDEWRWEGKRYTEGIRAAIDAAILDTKTRNVL